MKIITICKIDISTAINCICLQMFETWKKLIRTYQHLWETVTLRYFSMQVKLSCTATCYFGALKKACTTLHLHSKTRRMMRLSITSTASLTRTLVCFCILYFRDAIIFEQHSVDWWRAAICYSWNSKIIKIISFHEKQTGASISRSAILCWYCGMRWKSRMRNLSTFTQGYLRRLLVAVVPENSRIIFFSYCCSGSACFTYRPLL